MARPPTKPTAKRGARAKPDPRPGAQVPRSRAAVIRAPAATKAAESAAMARLRARLREAEATLEAIRQGHVDALVVQGPAGEQVFTLVGADHRYRQLVETMNEGALLLSGDGTIVYGNARFAALAKLPLEQMIGARLHDLVPGQWHDLLEAVLRGGSDAPVKAEVELAASDGTRTAVYLSATASWDQIDPLLCVIATDLSDQKRSQEMVAADRLAARIVDQAADGIVVCDPWGRVIRVSQAAQRAAGENPLLRRFEDAFPLRAAGDPAVARTVVARALAGETINGLEVSLMLDGRDGAALLLSAGPILNDDGEPLGCVVSFVDVTDRRRAAEERSHLLEGAEAARAEAEQANRAKDEFLAMLGHELRNPLAPVLTALELMRMTGDDTFLRERQIIGRQVDLMVRLVDDLLDVSRIARGQIALHRRPLEIGDVVRNAVELAGPLLDERRHRVEVEIAAALWVDGDEARLCQVLANLLTNAAKYTPPGGHVRVVAGADGDHVVVSVHDDGIGIAPDMLATLFDRFTQGTRSIDRLEGGLGLGLALVRSLVALHGGTATAHSAGVGRGSTFELRLPALTGVAAPAPAPPSRRTASATPRRVLIVDDNDDIADLVAEALAARGHETRVAYDGPSALAVVAGFRPDIAFLDIGLPVMDGYELARRLREAVPDPALRLVAVTGYGQDSDREKSTEAGFDLHLVKPIQIGQLVTLIDAAPDAAPDAAAD